MKYQKLGKAQINVSKICMGCWALSGDKFWGPQSESDSIRTLHTAMDVGINFFDTAESYGDGYSEEILGKAFSHQREKIVIGTKVSPEHLSREKIIQACKASLRRLKTDYIDVYHIHFPNPEVPISETLEALKKLQDEGKIRAISVSNFGRKDLQEFLTHSRVEVDQLPYNLLWRAIEYEILPFCVQNNIEITCYSPLSQGLLTGKFRSPDEVPVGRARTRHFSGKRPMARHGEEGAESETFATIKDIQHIAEEINIPMAKIALAWLLTQEGITSVIVGARKPEQVFENVRAADLELPPDVIAKLTKATEKLKQKLGPNPDIWQSESRIR